MTECKLVSPGFVCKCRFDDEKCNKVWIDHCKEWKVIVFDVVAKDLINWWKLVSLVDLIGTYHVKESNINQNAKLCELI